MEEYNILRMQDRLKEYLTRDRFIHTQGVMYTATALAMCHGEDLVKAQVAGLLHDCAKCIPTGKKLKICKKNDIALTKWEEENEALLHAKVGVYIAKKKYGITDPEILNAIRYHTTGKADMMPLKRSSISPIISSPAATRPRIFRKSAIWLSRISMRPCTGSSEIRSFI